MTLETQQSVRVHGVNTSNLGMYLFSESNH
jgi:hypothetical protein